MEHIELAGITAQRVPEAKRSHFLPGHFDTLMLIFERALYAQLTHLSPDYRGGHWDFYELSNGGCFLAPSTPKCYRVVVPGNYFEGTFDAQTVGVVATLFTLSHLSFRFPSVLIFTERFFQLREFAGEHREQADIFAAID